MSCHRCDVDPKRDLSRRFAGGIAKARPLVILTYICRFDMLRCMRTTVRLDESLMKDAKKAAAESGRTLTAVIEDALRESLSRRRGGGPRRRVRLPTFAGRGVLPGVDLDDTAALLDRMETPRDPR
jgi:hypothetical protein